MVEVEIFFDEPLEKAAPKGYGQPVDKTGIDDDGLATFQPPVKPPKMEDDGHWTSIKHFGDTLHMFVNPQSQITAGPQHLIGHMTSSFAPEPGRTIVGNKEEPPDALQHPTFAHVRTPKMQPPDKAEHALKKSIAELRLWNTIRTAVTDGTMKREHALRVRDQLRNGDITLKPQLQAIEEEHAKIRQRVRENRLARRDPFDLPPMHRNDRQRPVSSAQQMMEIDDSGTPQPEPPRVDVVSPEDAAQHAALLRRVSNVADSHMQRGVITPRDHTTLIDNVGRLPVHEVQGWLDRNESDADRSRFQRLEASGQPADRQRTPDSSIATHPPENLDQLRRDVRRLLNDRYQDRTLRYGDYNRVVQTVNNMHRNELENMVRSQKESRPRVLPIPSDESDPRMDLLTLAVRQGQMSHARAAILRRSLAHTEGTTAAQVAEHTDRARTNTQSTPEEWIRQLREQNLLTYEQKYELITRLADGDAPRDVLSRAEQYVSAANSALGQDKQHDRTVRHIINRAANQEISAQEAFALHSLANSHDPARYDDILHNRIIPHRQEDHRDDNHRYNGEVSDVGGQYNHIMARAQSAGPFDPARATREREEASSRSASPQSTGNGEDIPEFVPRSARYDAVSDITHARNLGLIGDADMHRHIADVYSGDLPYEHVADLLNLYRDHHLHPDAPHDTQPATDDDHDPDAPPLHDADDDIPESDWQRLGAPVGGEQRPEPQIDSAFANLGVGERPVEQPHVGHFDDPDDGRYARRDARIQQHLPGEYASVDEHGIVSSPDTAPAESNATDVERARRHINWFKTAGYISENEAHVLASNLADKNVRTRVADLNRLAGVYGQFRSPNTMLGQHNLIAHAVQRHLIAPEDIVRFARMPKHYTAPALAIVSRIRDGLPPIPKEAEGTRLAIGRYMNAAGHLGFMDGAARGATIVAAMGSGSQDKNDEVFNASIRKHANNKIIRKFEELNPMSQFVPPLGPNESPDGMLAQAENHGFIAGPTVEYIRAVNVPNMTRIAAQAAYVANTSPTPLPVFGSALLHDTFVHQVRVAHLLHFIKGTQARILIDDDISPHEGSYLLNRAAMRSEWPSQEARRTPNFGTADEHMQETDITAQGAQTPLPAAPTQTPLPAAPTQQPQVGAPVQQPRVGAVAQQPQVTDGSNLTVPPLPVIYRPLGGSASGGGADAVSQGDAEAALRRANSDGYVTNPERFTRMQALRNGSMTPAQVQDFLNQRIEARYRVKREQGGMAALAESHAFIEDAQRHGLLSNWTASYLNGELRRGAITPRQLRERLRTDYNYRILRAASYPLSTTRFDTAGRAMLNWQPPADTSGQSGLVGSPAPVSAPNIQVPTPVAIDRHIPFAHYVAQIVGAHPTAPHPGQTVPIARHGIAPLPDIGHRDAISERLWGGQRHYDFDINGDIAQATRDVIGHEVSREELADLIGTPVGARVYIGATYGLEVHSTGQNPHYNNERVIGRRSIHNSLFRSNEPQQSGLGARIFGRQVENARRHGFLAIDTSAAGTGDGRTMAERLASGDGDRSWSGYVTWPRLGYNRNLTRDEKDRVSRAHPSLSQARTVLDLIATPEGSEWWERYGTGSSLSFDLDPNSQSSRWLKAYMRARNIYIEPRTE